MSNEKPPTNLTPALSGYLPVQPTGREPALSRKTAPRRKSTIGSLLEQLNSPVIHVRFNTIIALSDYPSSPSAGGAVIRALRDDSLLVRLAALFALAHIGPRLENPLLQKRAVGALRAILHDSSAQITRLAANTLIGLSASSRTAPLGVDALAQVVTATDDGVIPFSVFAIHALERIGTPEALSVVTEWRDHREMSAGS